MNIQDQTPEGNTNPLPDALAPPSDVGAQADSSGTTPATPAPTRTPEQDSAYADAVRSMRRAHLPQSAIDSMEESAVLDWQAEYSPIQSGIDQSFQRVKELERELVSLKEAQATPGKEQVGSAEAAKLEELGLDPKMAQTLGAILDARLAPMQEAHQLGEQQRADAALSSAYYELQPANPTLSDPRVMLKVKEEAERQFQAYPQDPKKALLNAVAIVTGGASAQAPDPSKNRGQPGVGSQTAASPSSYSDDLRAHLREIMQKNR